ncbi:MAG TPA: Rieske (2Fe-2S) protein [Kofleriaceae bacterium]
MVLRGAGAALLAALSGCTDSTPDGSDPTRTPDANTSGGGGSGGGGGGGGGTSDAGTTPTPLGPGLERCGTQICLSLKDSANAALRTVEGARVFDVDGRKLIVVRITTTTFATLSAICTHEGCTVKYSTASDDLECPCHGARFAMDGAVKIGPANTPLAKYATSYDAASDTVKVTLA